MTENEAIMAQAYNAQEDLDRAEKMAAYRNHSRELGGGLAGSGIGYVGTPYVTRSIEAENRRQALQIAWDLYRDKGNHELVLKAATAIADFLDQKDKLS